MLSKEAALDLMIRVRLCHDETGLAKLFAECVDIKVVYDVLKVVYPAAHETYVVKGKEHPLDQKRREEAEWQEFQEWKRMRNETQ